MRIWLSVLALVLAFAGVAHADEAILVLDGSGSMWGKIEGKTKVEIARSVVDNMLDKLPKDRSLGLVAYGHRRQGDCTDIEEIVPIGTDRAAIRTAVDKLNFKGKTPLGAAVRFAAEKLRYTQQKATVILVSDGAETCGVDPCALGRELEAKGADFTAHIIGFGLASETESAGLKCLAEATGGKYVSAKNASELTAALAQTVAAPAPPPPAKPQAAHVTLRATELDGGPDISSGLTWEVKPASGTVVFSKSNGGIEQADIAPGSYTVSVVRTNDGLKGTATLQARAGAERTVTIPLQFPVNATLTVTPAAAAPAGSTVQVDWKGPNRKGDYITVVKADAEPTAYLDYQYTAKGAPTQIKLPAEPGDYEVRYVLGSPQRVLATAPIKSTVVTASLTALDTALAGSTIDVAWTGPNYANDWITIVKPDDAPAHYNDYFNTKDNKNALKTPVEPGDYEIRYVQDGQKVLARRPITLTAASASITAPATAAVGSTVKFTWTGPKTAGDWITIVKPDAPASTYNDYFNASDQKSALQMPVEPGSYELRYVQGGTKVIARAPITLSVVSVSITAPATVKPGTEFEISWNGPDNNGDWLTIVAPSDAPTAYKSYVDAPRGNPAKLTAPPAPGTYEVRYVLRGKSVIGRKTIEVK